jgi:DNA-binding transcriptional ArsR family regulator
VTLPYGHLPEQAQRVYELLAEHPGPDATAAPLAAALNMTQPAVTVALHQLSTAGLVIQPRPGERFALATHVRQHATHQRAQLPEATRAQHIARLIDWYTAAAADAVPLIAPDTPRFSAPVTHTSVPQIHDDARHAHLWSSWEHRLLRNILTTAARHHHDDLTVELAEAIWHLARPTYHHDDLVHAQHTGHTTAADTQPAIAAVFRAREATGLADLGHLGAALDAITDATALAHDTDDPGVLAVVYSHRGSVHLVSGHPDEALHDCTFALHQHRHLVDDHGHAVLHRRVGQAHLALGHPDDALRYLHASSEAMTRTRHPLSAARAQTYLADALTATGQPTKALSAVWRAHRLLGDNAAPRYRVGIDLAAARAHHLLGDAGLTHRLTDNIITRLTHAGPGATADLNAATALRDQL